VAAGAASYFVSFILALSVDFLAIDRPWTGALTPGGSRRPCV